MIPHSITAKSISVLIDGRMRVIPATSVNFIALRDELRRQPINLKKVKGLVDIPSFIAKITVGRVRISADEVYFRDEKLVSYAAERLLQHLSDGDSIEPLARLLDKLMDNPDKTLREDLWKWIEKANLPICEDGDIVAFKKVSPGYNSYSRDEKENRIFDWHVGNMVSMPREDCDPNRHDDCSTGLHFCSYGYLPGFHGNNGHVVILKINPRDVTSIPYSDTEKGRMCLCEVIDEVPEDEAKHFFSGNVVSNVGTYQEPEHSSNPGWDAFDDDPYDYSDEEDPLNDSEDYEDDSSDFVSAEWYADDEPNDGFTMIISGKRFNIQTVKDTVASLGQRGAAQKLGVPRTSLQDALKRLG